MSDTAFKALALMESAAKSNVKPSGWDVGSAVPVLLSGNKFNATLNGKRDGYFYGFPMQVSRELPLNQVVLMNGADVIGSFFIHDGEKP